MEQHEAMKKMSKILECLEATNDMRNAQIAFFKTREREHLNESKRLEKKVDALLEEIWPSKKTFGTLFDTNQ